MTHIFSENMKEKLYGSAWKGKEMVSSDEVFERLTSELPASSQLDQMLYVYSKQWCADDLLLKADKMTMAHSIELRVPFLDHSFVEFAASLPTDMKLRKTGEGI